MSVRALAWTAALLGLLVVATALLTVQRLGYLEEAKAPQFLFLNPTLAVARGQRVVIRPMLEGAPWRRYTFLVSVAEPQPDDPVYPAPHLRAGVEELGGDGVWYRLPVGEFIQPLAMSQMGAVSIQEWLVEIRPVRERRSDGAERVLLRALFGHSNGATIAYLFDPARPVPAFGWVRQETHGPQGGEPEIQYASDGGRVAVE